MNSTTFDEYPIRFKNREISHRLQTQQCFQLRKFGVFGHRAVCGISRFDSIWSPILIPSAQDPCWSILKHVPWPSKINWTMTFLNNFCVSKLIPKLSGHLREGVCPSLWFQYELLTPLELGERSISVKKFRFGKTKTCMCYNCPTPMLWSSLGSHPAENYGCHQSRQGCASVKKLKRNTKPREFAVTLWINCTWLNVCRA